MQKEQPFFILHFAFYIQKTKNRMQIAFGSLFFWDKAKTFS